MYILHLLKDNAEIYKYVESKYNINPEKFSDLSLGFRSLESY